MNKIWRAIGGGLLGLAFVLGFYTVTSMTAQAQYRNDQYRRNRDWNRDNDDRNDRDREREWRGRREREAWQNRNRDWNRDRYRRDGYGNYGTYGDYGGYGNNGNYGNNNNYELNRGYQQGVSTGASDAQRGQSYSPQRSHYYRGASSQQFRNAFVQGYDVGYRQYGGYNNNGGYRGGNSSSILGRILGGR